MGCVGCSVAVIRQRLRLRCKVSLQHKRNGKIDLTPNSTCNVLASTVLDMQVEVVLSCHELVLENKDVLADLAPSNMLM